MSLRVLHSLVVGGWVLAPVVPAGTQGTPEEPRIALLIGNSAYKGQPLRYPVNDVRSMARTLRELGFTVLAHKNTSQRTLETAVIEFGQRLTRGGGGFFHYAGHGLQVRGHNQALRDAGASDARGLDLLERQLLPCLTNYHVTDESFWGLRGVAALEVVLGTTLDDDRALGKARKDWEALLDRLAAGVDEEGKACFEEMKTR